jgi:hypothetical protein
MVFAAGPGLTLAELAVMDFYDYAEAVEARLIWQEEWNPKPKIPQIKKRYK